MCLRRQVQQRYAHLIARQHSLIQISGQLKVKSSSDLKGKLATKAALDKHTPELDRVRCYRLKHYYDLVNRKPEQERFIFGWYKRALSV